MSLSEHRPSLPEVYRSIAIPNAKCFWRKLLSFAGSGYLVSVGYMDILWVLCEISISACDLAELLGSAIALQLLFGLPLIWGACLTALDVLALLFLQGKGFRYVEGLVILLIATVGICFGAEILFSRPDVGGILQGYVPNREILRNPQMLYIAIGILGATVMPHNLYLHSSIVQTRNWQPTPKKRWEAIKFGTIDSTVALSFALLINGAILIVSAATFHFSGNHDVAEIQDAYQLLSPLLGVGAASAIFGVALLASGQSSTLTATLAGQIVMEDFLQIKLPPWVRRLATRLIAIIPALIAIVFFGKQSTAWAVAILIAGLNAWLLVQTVVNWMQ
jgi:manganese transport protein